MNKKIVGIFVALMAVAMIAPALVPAAQATVITQVNHVDGYTEYLGTLGEANFYVLIPDVWTNPLGNGMLVVFCRPALWTSDPRGDTTDYNFARTYLAPNGIAVAASNYGLEHSGVKEGVISTYLLTLYVILKFHVTGKVFLFGTSLGGAVALLLGATHPKLYSGVLDLVGVKDFAYLYNTYANYQGGDPFWAMMCGMGKQGLETYFGGTPQQKPFNYAIWSPIHHPFMAIPVISVVNENDMLVDPMQNQLYHAALWNPSLHMIVPVTAVTPGNLPIPGATGWYGHFDPANWMTAFPMLFNLIAWSNTLHP